MEREEVRELKCGMKLYSYKNPGLNGFYISLFLRAGSMYESERDSGITHFLEHVAIRNVNALMSGRLYALLDRYGIEFNASTYSEMVHFYVSGASRNFKVGAEIISKLFQPIALSAEDIRTECERIKAEIRENDERGSLVNFTSQVVHEGTTLARSITGSASSISKITKSRLENYRKSVFTGENLFLYVTGSFSDADIDALASLIDNAELGYGAAHLNIAPVSAGFFSREPRVYIKNADYTMVRFTFDMDMTKISVAESDLLYDILLGGYNSRFFIEMSEREGLFYDLAGASERYKNIGTLAFYYEVKPSVLYTAVEKTLEILRSFVKEPPSDAECMKAGYVDNAYMLYDDMRELNFTMAYDNHVLDAGYASLDERIAAYKGVSPERISKIADMIFRPENLTLTVKGRKSKIDEGRLEALIRNFVK
ncbi:MAG: insulinase family protein [Clostridia bacterium]|nr:insulinase family protein [Clostridia bacterium]